MEYVEATQARALSGLRLVLTRGFPSPWGEFAKGVFAIKRLPFTAVSHYAGQPNDELREWTGQTSAPAAVYCEEPPRTSWAPILHLAERLVPEPSLLPVDECDRVLMLGLCEEMGGEDGLGWNRRRQVLVEWEMQASGNELSKVITTKYGGCRKDTDEGRAIERIVTVLNAMDRQARAMRAAGQRYLIGGRLSALDIMWASFAQQLDALPPQICALPDAVRTLYTASDPQIRAALTPALLDHRDFMYTAHIPPPTHL